LIAEPQPVYGVDGSTVGQTYNIDRGGFVLDGAVTELSEPAVSPAFDATYIRAYLTERYAHKSCVHVGRGFEGVCSPPFSAKFEEFFNVVADRCPLRSDGLRTGSAPGVDLASVLLRSELFAGDDVPANGSNRTCRQNQIAQ